jgi:hypothetical protein
MESPVERRSNPRTAFWTPDGYNRLDIGATMSAFDRLLNRAKDTTNESAKGAKTP